MKPTIIIAVILILAVSHLSTYYLGRSHVEIKYRTQIDTLIEYKTNIIEKIVPKYYTVIKKDTIILIEGNDTIYIDNTQYIAQVDTSLENDDAKLMVQYVQDLPLSQNGFFNIDLRVKNTTVFVPTYKQEERDTWGVGFGILGHFQDSVKVNLFGNISYKIMNFKYFEMPITAEIELGDNLNIIDKKLRIEGRFKF